MNELSMLLGAAPVIAGVLASALADRIRGIRSQRAASLVQQAPRPKAEIIGKSLGDQIVEVLVRSGYTQAIARRAVWECKSTERKSIEQWTRAALACALTLAGGS